MRGKLNRCLGTSPANLGSAYGFQSATSGLGMTVAMVTAFDDPDAESDLGVYRAQFGLPACTTANGCFSKVNQTGGTTYPPAGWSGQDAESLDAISAVCPNCHIILVEATSTTITDLGTAENEAVDLGAKFVDNDWIIPETEIGAGETSDDALYCNHPGVAITAPAGDGGYANRHRADPGRQHPPRLGRDRLGRFQLRVLSV
jgi:subtilase family serine protease